MTGSFNSGDLLGGGLGRLALAVCILGAVALLVPIGLASVGFGAILGAAGGLGARSAAGTAGQLPISQTIPTTGRQSGPVAIAPIQSVVAAPHGLITGWVDRGPLNQYGRSNYRTDANWLTWRNADCSAAALDWLLGAYGQPLGSLDDAIALVGPGTGISASLGLLDARRTALARALAARGLQPRTPGQRPLGSIAELEAWLDKGPLFMDGARWFGEGHWFVRIGYDSGGLYIRDSSGWDIRYLSWSRVYGMWASAAGWSAWLPDASQLSRTPARETSEGAPITRGATHGHAVVWRHQAKSSAMGPRKAAVGCQVKASGCAAKRSVGSVFASSPAPPGCDGCPAPRLGCGAHFCRGANLVKLDEPRTSNSSSGTGVTDSPTKRIGFLRRQALPVGGPLREIAQNVEAGPIPLAAAHAAEGLQQLLQRHCRQPERDPGRCRSACRARY